MKEFFPNVPKIEYKGTGGDALSFKFYNPDEVVGGKTMKEHLKFAMSYWHTLCGDGDPTDDDTDGENSPGKRWRPGSPSRTDEGGNLLPRCRRQGQSRAARSPRQRRTTNASRTASAPIIPISSDRQRSRGSSIVGPG